MSQTPPHFSLKARDGKARCGVLATNHGNIDTPAVLLYTRRGGPLSLTSPDMLAALSPPVQGVQLSVMQFLENPDAATLREYGHGAHGFLGLESHPVLASNRDPTIYEFCTRPSSDREVHVSIHSGGHMVSPARYMDTVAALKPDIYVTLCDEVTADARPKRITTSIKRTTAWLDACLALHEQHSQRQLPAAGAAEAVAGAAAGAAEAEMAKATGQAGEDAVEGAEPSSSGRADGDATDGKAGPLAGSLALAALTGGALVVERTKAAKAVGAKPGVGGYALCGLGTGETPETRPALIAASLAGLGLAEEEAARRPVFAAGLASSPEELLVAVAAGVDLLDCAYVAQVTAGGYALTFPLRPPPGWQPPAESSDRPTAADGAGAVSGDGPAAAAGEPAEPAAAATGEPAVPAAAAAGEPAVPGTAPDVSIGADDTKMNLWSTSYRLDKGPLLPGCGCFSCRLHSRAYVHHLLNAHEMLADVLLEAHNTSHMNGFCQAIREAIAEGRFTQYQQWFGSLRSAPLAPMARVMTAKRRAEGPPEGTEGRKDAAAAGGGEAQEAGTGAGADGGAREGGCNKWVRV